MYDRTHEDRVLSFEASGALRDAALMLRDRETDSWWSIMQGRATHGELAGRSLQETAWGETVRWAEWRKRHPDTKVLAVNGRTHEEQQVYADYFSSDGTFRDQPLTDDRLPAKASVFAFRRGGTAYAVPHADIDGERTLTLGDEVIVLRRAKDADPLASTKAFRRTDNGSLEPVPGIDSYWYTWAAQNPGTVIPE